MKIRYFVYAFHIIQIFSPIFGKPVGWFDPQLVVQNIEEYNTASDKNGDLYVVYSRLALPFNKDRDQSFIIGINSFGNAPRTVKLAEINLPSLQVQFSITPSIAVSNNKIMVVWQRPAPNGRGMMFEYILMNKETLVTEIRSRIPVKDLETYQPAAYAGSINNFHIFFQKRTTDGNMSLAQIIFQDGKFKETGPVIKNLKNVGRGAFFPSIVFNNGMIHVVYQSRRTDTLTDELYYTYSKNYGESFSDSQAITNNVFNDFSPFLLADNGNVELVWQSNENENWQIYYSPDLKDIERVTNSLSNCYQPVLAKNKKTGRILAWHDQRINPPQIFAKFLDEHEDVPMKKEHQVTYMKSFSINPSLVTIGDNMGLLYMSDGNLFVMKADKETAPILISSPTHPENRIVTANDVRLTWNVQNEPSGIEDYAYVIDNRPDSLPNLYNINGETRFLNKKGLAGGNYFFHIRYRDKAGNESPVFHYPFTIDASSPILAEVNSATHKDNTPEKSHDFLVNFSAVDDIGVKGYNYVLTTNRGAALRNYTEKNELDFKNLNDGLYYFLVQAVDKAGRVSPVVSYRLNIVPEDYDDFLILHNISEGRVESDFVDLSIQINKPEKHLKSVYAVLSPTTDNPFLHGQKLELTDLAGIIKSQVKLPMHKWGLYTLSLGLEYDDSSRSTIRNFHFEYYNEAVMASIRFAQRGKLKIIKKYAEDLGLLAGIKPIIELIEDRGLYKVEFSIPENYRKLLQGFTYQVSDIPSLPVGDLNYVKDPIYLYDLEDGIYYLSVKPVFINEKANKLASYSYLRFTVKSKPLWEKYAIFGSIIIILFIVIIRFKSEFRFYLSRYK